jgi:capsular exopolysaccharide synthesis family protein
MELADYLRVLRARWIALAALVAILAVAALIYSGVQSQVYSATASGFVTFGPATDANTAHANDVLSKSRAQSYVGLARDRATAAIVIDELDLDVTPEALVDDIEVVQTPDTVLVSVNARAETPSGAQDLADAWIAALAERVADIESVEGDQGLRIENAESALLPSGPESPRVGLNVLAAVALGALLGGAYVVGSTLLDRRLRSQHDVEATVGVGVLGWIPELSGSPSLIVAADGQDVQTHAAEEVRRLRTNLAYIDEGRQPRSVVVTSPNDGDGKTTVAINLAAAIALSGQPVTLVDADLRRANLAGARGLDAAVGLTQVLAGDVQLDEALQSDPEIAGLEVLTAGSVPDNPSELLGSDAMASLIGQLSSRGAVIIDASSLLPVTDAAILGHLADGALVVINAGATRDIELETAVKHLHTVNARPLGVVLNRAPRRSSGKRVADRVGDGYDSESEDSTNRESTLA